MYGKFYKLIENDERETEFSAGVYSLEDVVNIANLNGTKYRIIIYFKTIDEVLKK